MANTYTWKVGSGLWSTTGNWTTNPVGLNSYPGEAGTTDAVTIAVPGTNSVPIVVTYDPSSATIGSLTLSGNYETLLMGGTAHALTIDVPGVNLTGLLSGTNDLLSMTGTGQTLTIDLGGIDKNRQDLTTGSGNVLAIGANALDVVNSLEGSVWIEGSGNKVTLAGGSFNATGAALRVQLGDSISGYGSVIADKILYSTSFGGKITASGGTLNVTVNTTPATQFVNIISNQIVLGIDDSVGGDLALSGKAVQGNALTLDNANQTLELKSDGVLVMQIAATQSITNATVQLDGGNASYQSTGYGVDLGSGARLIGAGTVAIGGAAGGDFRGAGTVTAEYLPSSTSTLTFDGAVDLSGSTTSFKIDSGATLAFKGQVGTSGIAPTIDFSTSGTFIAKLDLSTAAGRGFYGVVQNFYNFVGVGSDQILVGGSATNNSLFVTDVNGNVAPIGGDHTNFIYVSVYNGPTLIDRIDMGSYANAVSVGFISGSQRTTLVTTETICFMAGTMIRTPDGEVAVETLKRGDLVLTSDGLVQPVCWLGRQTGSTRFADPLRVLPIRIKAGALAENVPGRDLLLSPDHAVLVDGALIHAGALVNDTSILRETAVPEIFTYYHVELDDHSLVLAENTPAETFVDNVERLAFDNWAEHEALYPEGKSIAELPYPRAKGRRQVPVYVRVLLAERAAIIGAANPAAMVA
jgi:hypothetical protein